MNLATRVRRGVARLNCASARLQDTVTLKRFTGYDDNGDPQFNESTVLSLKGLVSYKAARVPSDGDHEILSRASVTFLVPIASEGAAGRNEPVDNRDVLTLPDGTTGPILDVRGLNDPSTHAPYALQVFLG